FIPAAVAATLYALFTYLILPFYRNHYARYRQYLPLSVNSSPNARGLRTRFTDWLVNAMIPNSMRWGRDGDVVRYTSATDPDGTGARRGGDSFDSEVYVFGDEEGERLVGFDHERLPRGRDERGGVVEVASDRRLSRELEAGFKDESSEESGDDGRRGLVAAMYDEAACVEVLVRPHDSDTAYREYRAPRPSICSGRENERYIEAVNDERFEVVRVCVSEVCKEIATCEDGKWRCVGFSFRELQAVEAAHLTIKEELEALNRGRIEVTVQVGRRKRIGGIYNSGNSYALPGKTSTKVAIDEGKSHGVAAVPVDFEVAEKVKTAFH
ncbi:hypothetical protein KC324_g5739, partial [Hortaea werneckii]